MGEGSAPRMIGEDVLRGEGVGYGEAEVGGLS
jgi:hypothetical protein